jgi:hypothetical protein
MLIVFLLNLWLNPTAWTEIRESFRLPEDDKPLGEAELEQWLEEEKNN